MSQNIVVQLPLHANARSHFSALLGATEQWLESERDSLPLLIPVALGLGISIWQLASDGAIWTLVPLCTGLILLGLAIGWGRRCGAVLVMGAALILAGFAAISAKSALHGADPLTRPWVGTVNGRVERIEDVAARGLLRLRLDLGVSTPLPRRVRINIPRDEAGLALRPGAIIAAKVRLLPPPGPALPGAYDFARTAWFDGLGATGRAVGAVKMVSTPQSTRDFWGTARTALATRIAAAMGPQDGPVGAALLVGSRGAISEADAEALRNSGMAHLLSVSGLHVTAVVGGSFLLIANILALFPALALRVAVPLLAAGGAALVAIFYTLLTGSEVPTVRACIAALLILVATAIGREALSLRLLAAGATFILLIWPEALAGPSFQLSFAAVGTIILLHASPAVRKFTAKREESWLAQIGRMLLGLLATGLAIELALAPIALFHFHKSGLYGALANMAAIPLTTLLIMPAQLLGLLGDAIRDGAGWPFWWIATQGVAFILRVAHGVSSAPGAVAMLPEMPHWAFATAVLSALHIALFKTRWRLLAIVPLAAAGFAMVSAPRPDMLLTGDGRHLAIVDAHGAIALLRPAAGDYARSMLSESAAAAGDPLPIDRLPGARCNSDACSISIVRGARRWSILALRSNYMIPVMELAAACRRSDIVISSRYLPYSCRPLWLKADRRMLEQTGGLSVYLAYRQISTVADETGHLPWSDYSAARLAARREARTAKGGGF